MFPLSSIVYTDLDPLLLGSISKFKASSDGMEYRLYVTRSEVPEDAVDSLSAMELFLSYSKPFPRNLLAMIPRPESREGLMIEYDPTAVLSMCQVKGLPRKLASKLDVLCSKAPVFNQEKGPRSLYGRVQVESSKNFQLCMFDPDDTERTEGDVVLQFGRATEERDDIFILDFSWPFSAHTAFAMALSAFDKK